MTNYQEKLIGFMNQGLSNKEIAKKLKKTEGAVSAMKTYMRKHYAEELNGKTEEAAPVKKAPKKRVKKENVIKDQYCIISMSGFEIHVRKGLKFAGDENGITIH